MNINTRYWCHVCNKTSNIYTEDDIQKCQYCNSDFIEVIEHSNYNRFTNLSIISQDENEPISNDIILQITEFLRHMEDRYIMELREMTQTEQIVNDTFEDSHTIESRFTYNTFFFSIIRS